MKQQYLLLAVFFLLFSCQKEGTSFEQTPETIVIINQLKNNNVPVRYFSQQKKDEIIFTTDFDTLRLESEGKPIELSIGNPKTIRIDTMKSIPHYQKVILFPNDTVVLTPSSKKFTEIDFIKNGQKELTYQNLIEQEHDNEAYSSQFILEHIFMFAFTDFKQKKDKESYKNPFEPLKEGHTSKALQELAREEQILDSLLSIDKVSENQYNVFKQNIILKKFNLNHSESRSIGSGIPPYLYSDEYKEMLARDSLFSLFSYRSTLNDLAQSHYRLHYSSKGGGRSNYLAIYDSLTNYKGLKTGAKNYLLAKAMDDIFKYESIIDSREYFQRFQSEVEDSTYINRLKRLYDTDAEITNDLTLISMTGEESSFSSIIEKYKAKAIYIDFWASWCAPCLQEMPASKKLHEDLAEEDVVFLYISTDEDQAAWKKASNKLSLADETNFVISNKHSSTFMDDLNIHSIPRYFIYDKNGDFLHKDAPRPSDERTKEILRELAK